MRVGRVAVYPHDAYEAEQLVEVADRQMYANKRARKAALLAA
jgi:predicted signal transduction protein with EAL and GGDEF domain